MAVRATDLFTTDDPIEIATKFEHYKDELNKSLGNPVPAGLSGENARVHKMLRGSPTLNKAMNAATISSVQRELVNGFVGKDLDIAGPGSTGGLHAYDLEAPAKSLVPRQTPLRNRISRQRGVGTAHEFKRILGYTGSQTGGVGLVHPAQGETDTVAFGPQSYRRGKKISYAGDHLSVPFRKYSLSDSVSWDAYYAGQGFQNLQQLSSTSTLYAAMLLEERMILGDRGTAAGFSGALSVPAAPTVTTPAATGDQAAVTGISAANAYVVVRATTPWGQTVVSAAGSSAFTAGDVVTISWAHVPGATGYDVYLGQGSTAPATTSIWYQASTAANTVTLAGAVVTSGARTASADNAAVQPTAHDSFDGILSYVLDPARTGYLDYVNGALTSDEPFQTAFSNMFDANAADPETILCNGHDRSALSNVLKSSSSSNYRINLVNGGDGTVGQLVTAVQNQVTGTMVDLAVHRFLPQGVMPIMSWTLPLPDSQIGECWSIVNVADYQGVSWPVIEFTYDFSVYWVGTFVAYASAWSGAIAGIAA